VENLSRESILAFLRDHRQELAERFGVRRIGLFGSFADNRQNVDSDIDLLVEMDEADFIRLVELQDFLEDTLQHRVDIIRTSRDIQTPFRRRIERQAIYA
jgi:predicted nucleotidyltransferase